MEVDEDARTSRKDPELYPVDDEMIEDEEAPEAGAAVQPPPASPEDVDGNWARPQRQRVKALPKPVMPTSEERVKNESGTRSRIPRMQRGASFVYPAEALTCHTGESSPCRPRV